MANESNNGAAKLKERILSAARADAEAVLSQSKEECAAIESQAERKMEQNGLQHEKARADAARAILERSRTNAELAARKNDLAARRMLIDRAFEDAYQALCALSEQERRAMCKRLLLAEAAGGETVLAAAADQAMLQGVLKEVNATLKAAGKPQLTLAEEAAQIAHGFVLRGAAYEKDCSYLSLLRDARAAEETGVAGILFG